MKVIAASLFALLALTGCAGSTGPLTYNNKQECEAAGGTWSGATNSCTLSARPR